MKRLLIAVLWSGLCSAQYTPLPADIPSGSTLPSSCTVPSQFTLTTTGALYTCQGGTFVLPPSSGGPPTGAAGGALSGTYPTPSLATGVSLPSPDLGGSAISQTVTAGTSGVSANHVVQKSTENPIRYNNQTSATATVKGIARTTVTVGQTFELAQVGLIGCVVEGAVTSGHYWTVGVTDKSKCLDTGQSALASICNTVPVGGVFQASGTDGQTVTVSIDWNLHGAKVCSPDVANALNCPDTGTVNAMQCNITLPSTYTAYAFPLTVNLTPAYSNTGATFLQLNSLTSPLGAVTYTSGLTVSGSAGNYIVLTFSDGSVWHLALTGSTTLATTATFVSAGTGYTSAPTTATVTKGTATSVSGTALLTTSIGLPVLTNEGAAPVSGLLSAGVTVPVALNPGATAWVLPEWITSTTGATATGSVKSGSYQKPCTAGAAGTTTGYFVKIAADGTCATATSGALDGVATTTTSSGGQASYVFYGSSSVVCTGTCTGGDYALNNGDGTAADSGQTSESTIPLSSRIGGLFTSTGTNTTVSILLFGSRRAGTQTPAITGDTAIAAGGTTSTTSKINGGSFSGTQNDVVIFGASNTPGDSGILYSNLVVTTDARLVQAPTIWTVAQLLSVQYTSGLTVTSCSSGAYVLLTFTDGTTVHMPCANTNTITASTMGTSIVQGTGLSTAPTTATCSTGSAGTGCSGTALLATTLSVSPTVTGFFYNNLAAPLTILLPTLTSGLVNAQLQQCFGNYGSQVLTLRLPSGTYLNAAGTTGSAAGSYASSGTPADFVCVWAVTTSLYRTTGAGGWTPGS